MRDAEIRYILRQTHLSKYINDGESRIVEELKIPAAKARIDMAVINGHLHGFEIKGASDTLTRLPGQLEAYTKVFDYLSIITENRHEHKIIEFVPEWVGVYVCVGDSERGIIRQIRQPRINKNKTAFYIAKLLWHDELVDLLSSQNIPFKKASRNWILAEILANSLPMKKLSDLVRHKLKTRENWKQLTEGLQ